MRRFWSAVVVIASTAACPAPAAEWNQWGGSPGRNNVPEAVNLADEELWAIDSRIAPIAGEYVMLKKRASSFSGTPLAGYLRSAGVDTILVTGVTATACVRTTMCDGLAEGFRTIAVKECIGDRVPGAVAWNLYDIDAKFADVETVDTCVAYLERVGRKKQAIAAE